MSAAVMKYSGVRSVLAIRSGDAQNPAALEREVDLGRLDVDLGKLAEPPAATGCVTLVSPPSASPNRDGMKPIRVTSRLTRRRDWEASMRKRPESSVTRRTFPAI